jgi:hypothetical protein
MFICEPCCQSRYRLLEAVIERAPRYMGRCTICKKKERLCLDLNVGHLLPKRFDPTKPFEPEQPEKKSGKQKA